MPSFFDISKYLSMVSKNKQGKKIMKAQNAERVSGAKKNLKKLKVCLVGSSGGHLTHLYMLKPTWSQMKRFWVTFDKEDANSILEGEKVYHCFFPTNRNIKNLIKKHQTCSQNPKRGKAGHYYFLRRGRRGAIFLARQTSRCENYLY